MFKITVAVLFWFLLPVGFSFANSFNTGTNPVEYECTTAVQVVLYSYFANDDLYWDCGDTILLEAGTVYEGDMLSVANSGASTVYVIPEFTAVEVFSPPPTTTATTTEETLPTNLAVVAGLWLVVFFGTIWIMQKTT